MNSEGCGVMDQGGREVLIFFPGILPLSIFGASLVQISLDHKGAPDSRFTRNTQHGEDSLSSGKNSLPGSFPGCWAGRRVCAAQPEFRQETECPLSLRADLPLFSSRSLGVLPYASRLGGAGGTPTPLPTRPEEKAACHREPLVLFSHLSGPPVFTQGGAWWLQGTAPGVIGPRVPVLSTLSERMCWLAVRSSSSGCGSP